jgi:hypothetical protein
MTVKITQAGQPIGAGSAAAAAAGLVGRGGGITDATNPVTNSIYQRLGYRPAEDRLVLTFT